MGSGNGPYRDAYRRRSIRCAALFAGVMLLHPLASGAADEVRVTGTRVNVRLQPTTNSDVLFHVVKGDTLHVVERTGDWYLVQAPNGKRGYVHADLVETIKLREAAAAPSKVPITSPRLGRDSTEESLEQARERSGSEKRRRRGLYKMVGGAAGVASGILVMRSSKPAGIGLMGAGGYFLWDGFGERRDEARRMRWNVMLQVGRDQAGVAYHMSW